MFLLEIHYISPTYSSLSPSPPHRSSEGEASPIQVGFVTYDKVIHFYNVKVGGAKSDCKGNCQGGRWVRVCVAVSASQLENLVSHIN